MTQLDFSPLGVSELVYYLPSEYAACPTAHIYIHNMYMSIFYQYFFIIIAFLVSLIFTSV